MIQEYLGLGVSVYILSKYLADSDEHAVLIGTGPEQVPGVVDGTTEAQRGEGMGPKSHSELVTQLGLELTALSQCLLHSMAHRCPPARAKGTGGLKEIQNMTPVLRGSCCRHTMSWRV